MKFNNVISDTMCDITNELTEEMDKHLLDNVCPYFNTYICKNPRQNGTIYPIRFPGATRGFIKLDENKIIIEIKLHDDTCFDINGVHCYHESVREAVQKFIGWEFAPVKEEEEES